MHACMMMWTQQWRPTWEGRQRFCMALMPTCMPLGTSCNKAPPHSRYAHIQHYTYNSHVHHSTHAATKHVHMLSVLSHGFIYKVWSVKHTGKPVWLLKIAFEVYLAQPAAYCIKVHWFSLLKGPIDYSVQSAACYYEALQASKYDHVLL